MTLNQYSELFSVAIYHNYYEGGICKELQFSPSKVTQNLIEKYSFRLHTTTYGFSIYITTGQTIKDFLTYLKTTYDIISFSFDVTSSDPNFRLLTDYPILNTGTVSFYTPTEGDATTLKRKFVSSPTTGVAFNIDIDFDTIIRFRESGNIPNYNVQFESRKTQWRYYIINHSHQEFEKLAIQNNVNIQFEEPIEVILDNDQKALMLSSGSFTIPLMERSEYSFDLVDVSESANTATKIILKGLPLATPTFIETYTEGDTMQVASPIYIYL